MLIIREEDFAPRTFWLIFQWNSVQVASFWDEFIVAAPLVEIGQLCGKGLKSLLIPGLR